MLANDLTVFEFPGQGEGELSIELGALMHLGNAFASLMVACDPDRIENVSMHLVEARQGSLSVHFRPVVNWIHANHSPIASYSAVAALALTALQMTGCGQTVGPTSGRSDFDIQNENVHPQCLIFRESLNKALVGPVIIYVPDAPPLLIEPSYIVEKKSEFRIATFSSLDEALELELRAKQSPDVIDVRRKRGVVREWHVLITFDHLTEQEEEKLFRHLVEEAVNSAKMRRT